MEACVGEGTRKGGNNSISTVSWIDRETSEMSLWGCARWKLRELRVIAYREVMSIGAEVFLSLVYALVVELFVVALIWAICFMSQLLGPSASILNRYMVGSCGLQPFDVLSFSSGYAIAIGEGDSD